MQVLGGHPPGDRVRAAASLCTTVVCGPCVRGLDAAWVVAIFRIILSFARVCRVGVCFGFVRSALLLAVGTCVVLSFEAMPGLC